MPDVTMLGRILIAAGLIVAAVGVFMVFGVKLPWLGRLPGDILIQKKNATIFIPITTSIVISLAVSLLLYLLRRR